MDVRKLIINIIQKKGEVRVADITSITGFSRAYVNRFFQKLREDGTIVMIGKANQAHYIKASRTALKQAKSAIVGVCRIIRNENLSEDEVLKSIKSKTGIFLNMPGNISHILDYGFTEMLNNAIEHSNSKQIKLTMHRDTGHIYFSVQDKGMGIFNNIMKKKCLQNEMEAIQDLLKGKQTTAPEMHSGEGIFFTSKAADVLTIQSGIKKLIFDNYLNDIFIKNIKNSQGTKVNFSISLDSEKQLHEIFKRFTDDSFEFSKTNVVVRLYKEDTAYISRSQARRILSGLDEFKTIVLDFKGADTIGQGFADEVFRVWQTRYPMIMIMVKNANENIDFMIKRAKNYEK